METVSAHITQVPEVPFYRGAITHLHTPELLAPLQTANGELRTANRER
jgi:hypothetical protein